MLKIDLIAVGTRAPAWVVSAVQEYVKRMAPVCRFNVIEIKSANRHKSGSRTQQRQEEAHRLLAAVRKSARVVALDRLGEHWSTEELADNLDRWGRSTNHYQFLIGGPDGLAKPCLMAANDTLSLSRMTFPHSMVRVLLVEQIYRALMINVNHPYHR